MLSPNFDRKLAIIIVYWTDDMTLQSRWNCVMTAIFWYNLIVFNPSLVFQIITPPSTTTVTNDSNSNGHNIHQVYARHYVKCLAALTHLIRTARWDLPLLIPQPRQESDAQILKDQDKDAELVSRGVMIWTQAPDCCGSLMAHPPHTK